MNENSMARNALPASQIFDENGGKKIDGNRLAAMSARLHRETGEKLSNEIHFTW